MKAWPVYFIKGRDAIELLEEQRLIAQPSSVIIIASESDPTSWHGSLTIGKPLDDALKQSLDIGRVLTVRFGYDGQRFLGRVRITEAPIDMVPFLWVEFGGVDVFQLK
jgi:hypothetical protein